MNSSRLNHLVCIEESVDANARYRYGVRQEIMVPQKYYVYVNFYCVHRFLGVRHMLMYSSYRKVDVHDGLVEDKGSQHNAFHDIRVIQHLYARVAGYRGRVFFVDEPEVMEECLRQDRV